MKKSIHCSEMYPFWDLANDTDAALTMEVTAEEYADYERTMDRFDYWQKRMQAAVEEHEGAT